MADEIVYIPYGDQEISLQEALTLMDNNVDPYLNSRIWARNNKKRNIWKQAYNELRKRNILGASKNGNKWDIHYDGEEIPISTYSPVQQQIWGDVANFIQQQMSTITPRKKENAEEKKEEAKKKNKFNADIFENDLAKYIGNQEYAGRESKAWLPEWLNKDTVENDIYGTSKRQAALATYLQQYRDQLKKDDYDFENSPYGSYEEFNNRLNTAVKALQNPEWNQEDKDALNRLGLNREVWLSTGENAPVQYTDGEGNVHTITRAQYNALVAEQEAAVAAAKIKTAQEAEETKQKEEAAKKFEEVNRMKAAASKYKSMWTGTAPQMAGVADFANISEIQNTNDIIPYLRKQLSNVKTTSMFKIKKNLIHGGYKIAYDNKLLKPISEETWQALRKMKGSERYEGGKNKLYQIEGINNIIYNAYLNKIIFLSEDAPVRRDAIQQYKKYREQQYQNAKDQFFTKNPWGYKQGGTLNNLDIIIENFLNK